MNHVTTVVHTFFTGLVFIWLGSSYPLPAADTPLWWPFMTSLAFAALALAELRVGFAQRHPVARRRIQCGNLVVMMPSLFALRVVGQYFHGSRQLSDPSVLFVAAVLLVWVVTHEVMGIAARGASRYCSNDQ